MLKTELLEGPGNLWGVGFIIYLDSLPLLFLILPITRDAELSKFWSFGYYGEHKKSMN